MSSLLAMQGDDDQVIETGGGRRVLAGLFTILLILSLAAAAVVKLSDPATLPIRHVGVAGNLSHLSPQSLEQRVSGVARGGFFNINVEAIQRVLLEEPWVRAVSVKRVWPDRITVIIEEQVAVARWRDDGLVNAEAGIFYPDAASYPADLPVLNGPDNTSRQLLEHLALIRESLPPHMSISALELSDRRSWRLQLAGGLEVRLGRTGAIERFRRFVRHFPYDGDGNAGIRYVDMRYTNGFSIRWEPEFKPELGKRQANNGEKI